MSAILTLSSGFTVAAFNRTVSKVDHFLENEAKGAPPSPQTLLTTGKSIVGAHSMQEFCGLLKRPRRVMLLVKAGPAVDDFIEQLLPHLEKGNQPPPPPFPPTPPPFTITPVINEACR